MERDSSVKSQDIVFGVCLIMMMLMWISFGLVDIGFQLKRIADAQEILASPPK